MKIVVYVVGGCVFFVVVVKGEVDFLVKVLVWYFD